MSPFAATRRQISCAARWCRGSVVRMKSSLEMSRSLAHLPERRRHLVGERLRLEAGLLRRAFDLLAVLVGAGQEKDLVAQQPPRPRDRIGHHRRVGMADDADAR